jgi:hypothetical protein
MFAEPGISHKERKKGRQSNPTVNTVNRKSSFDAHGSHVVPIIPQAARIKLSSIFAATEGLHV